MVMMDSVSLDLVTFWVRFGKYEYYISGIETIVQVCFGTCTFSLCLCTFLQCIQIEGYDE